MTDQGRACRIASPGAFQPRTGDVAGARQPPSVPRRWGAVVNVPVPIPVPEGMKARGGGGGGCRAGSLYATPPSPPPPEF